MNTACFMEDDQSIEQFMTETTDRPTCPGPSLLCLPHFFNSGVLSETFFFCVCVYFYPAACLVTLKQAAADNRGEVNLGDWCTCLNTDRNLCNTSCTPRNGASSFHSSFQPFPPGCLPFWSLSSSIQCPCHPTTHHIHQGRRPDQ